MTEVTFIQADAKMQLLYGNNGGMHIAWIKRLFSSQFGYVATPDGRIADPDKLMADVGNYARETIADSVELSAYAVSMVAAHDNEEGDPILSSSVQLSNKIPTRLARCIDSSAHVPKFNPMTGNV